MAGSTLPRAAAHSGAMSYVRFGAGRGPRGFAAGAAGFFAAVRRGRSDRCRGAAGFTRLRARAAGAGGAAGRGATAAPGKALGGSSGTGSGSCTTSGSVPSGNASAAGPGRPVRTPVGAGGAPAPGTAPGPEAGATVTHPVTHPAATASATMIRGTLGPRRDSIRPPCPTNARSPAPAHPHGWSGLPGRRTQPQVTLSLGV
ncbi:hypothetical protein ACODT5_20205 [Streptomyces sp. 5.8]|uniref:hypothetical protein n=1 Tax=Streptomyces sp. 5.8 TaxID=3406571 RepID=UPI003BB63BC8